MTDMTDNTRPAPPAVDREAIADLIRFCLKFTDKQAGEGNCEAHDGLCDRWDGLGWDVGDKGWIEDTILQAIAPAPEAGWRGMDSALREAIALTEELCEAVDCEASDIGGQRGSLAILQEIGPKISEWRKALSAAPGAQPEPDPVKAVFVRSQAIRDFCEAAGIKASVQVAHLPDDVKRFRAEAALNHKRALRSLSDGEGA